MQYSYLGRTGLKVSRLCLGTMNFGPNTSKPDSFEIMSEALDKGINFFDTANIYGQEKGHGATEKILGSWFEAKKGRREKIVLATKVYGRVSNWPNEGRLSARHIRLEVEQSLRRLKTDYIDLYQMHHIDRNAPWEEVWQAMEMLVQQGKVLYVGSSNFAAWHIAQAQEIAKSRNFLGLVSEQSLYNLMNRQIELEVIPACENYGIGLIPWSPLAYGILGGTQNVPANGRRSRKENQQSIADHQKPLKAYEALCKEIGFNPAQIALAWLLHNPIVSAPIIGPRTLQQLESSLPALEIELGEEVLAKLDQIWPGPGGEAPEAYAW